ncbi:MAG: hypothetical protein FWG67_01720 [Defluviitaleaceae bacterium]|nr:hypothetical protein [Defluviitaleaceae bacterium]
MRRKKNEHQPHELIIEGQVGKLTAYTKKGKPVTALFDATDLNHIQAFENWRAVWNTELDAQVVESKTFKDGHAKRTPVAAAILACSPHAPIRHLNGDLLDNRRANLEIYDVKTIPNAYKSVEDGISISLKDRYAREVGQCLIDVSDLEAVVSSGHVWLKKKRANGQPYVVNTDGLLLAHFLLDVHEGDVKYRNKNPLDNRRENITIEPDRKQNMSD